MRAKNVIARLRATKPSSSTESTPLYRSTSANFSAYLVTARLLPYVGAELTLGGIVEFTFNDPGEKGPSLFHRYTVGAAELLNPRVLQEVRNDLIAEVRRLKAGAEVRNANQSAR